MHLAHIFIQSDLWKMTKQFVKEPTTIVIHNTNVSVCVCVCVIALVRVWEG